MIIHEPQFQTKKEKGHMEHIDDIMEIILVTILPKTGEMTNDY